MTTTSNKDLLEIHNYVTKITYALRQSRNDTLPISMDAFFLASSSSQSQKLQMMTC